MKSITLALIGTAALAGSALAQTPPAPPQAPKPPAAAPAAPTPPAPQPGQNAPSAPQPGAQAAAPSMPAPGGPAEGMVVETPNGFYLVRPGEAGPRKLDMGQGQAGQGRPGMAQAPGPGDEAMDDEDEGMQPPPPRPRHPPMRPMDGKGARFRIKTPNMTIGMKCPDDEPIKACVDAVSQLIDKANAPAH